MAPAPTAAPTPRHAQHFGGARKIAQRQRKPQDMGVVTGAAEGGMQRNPDEAATAQVDIMYTHAHTHTHCGTVSRLNGNQ